MESSADSSHENGMVWYRRTFPIPGSLFCTAQLLLDLFWNGPPSLEIKKLFQKLFRGDYLAIFYFTKTALLEISWNAGECLLKARAFSKLFEF